MTDRLTRNLRIWLACRRLNKLVAKRRREEAQYMKRREAGKLGWQRKRGIA